MTYLPLLAHLQKGFVLEVDELQFKQKRNIRSDFKREYLNLELKLIYR